jgi:hypothetical protein
MTDAQKRQYVANLYDGPKWKKQVEKMPDEQIVAIYLKHLNDGEMPEHEEPEAHVESEAAVPESLPEPVPHFPVAAPRPPHWNEDDFPIY